MDEFSGIFKRVPQLNGVSPEALQIDRLGGMTNRNYRLRCAEFDYMLRIPGDNTEEYIDRQAEQLSACITADVGVNAEVLFFDPEDGVQLTRFINTGDTMTPERFDDLEAVARAAIAFRALHQCGRMFDTRFDLFEMIDNYLGILESKGAALPAGYAEVHKEAEKIRTLLNDNPVVLAPCHCDPLVENFIDTGDRMYIIDWEYAGNNDPMWDLGDLSVEAGFTQEQDRALLEAYFDGPVPADKAGRMMIYKAMCDLLWTLWGVIQHVNNNPSEDFQAYALERFERCKALMGDPAFGKHFQAVKTVSLLGQ
jgi:thiamine kinase-like enzyme